MLRFLLITTLLLGCRGTVHAGNCTESEELLTGSASARPQLVFEKLEDLPVFLQKRWAEARIVKSPVKVESRWKFWERSEIPNEDAVILNALLETSLLSNRDPSLGWTQDRSAFIELVSESPRAILLRTHGHFYRVEGFDESVPGPYRVAGNIAAAIGNIQIGAVPWAEITKNEMKWKHSQEQKWFHSREAVGFFVETETGHLFSRVQDARFDKAKMETAWRDEETGLIWSSPSKKKTVQKEADAFC